MLDASREHKSPPSRFPRGLRGNPMERVTPPWHCCMSHPLLSSLSTAFGTGCHSTAPERTGGAGTSCFCRGFWILKALIAQHLIWRLKPAMETRNYLKYVFSSFLGREEEKLVSKKLLQVYNSSSEPRSSFHLSLRSDCSPSAHGKCNINPSLQPLEDPHAVSASDTLPR